MRNQLENSLLTQRTWRQILSDFGSTYAANGLIGFIFAATGPVAVILSVGTRGGLSPQELASWVFGVFFVNGLVSMLMSWRYTTPFGCVLENWVDLDWNTRVQRNKALKVLALPLLPSFDPPFSLVTMAMPVSETENVFDTLIVPLQSPPPLALPPA